MSEILNLLRNLQGARPAPAPVRPPRPAGERRPAVSPGGAISFTAFYRLRDNPFADALDLSRYYRTAAQEAAYRRMLASVEDGISLGLLTGPSGSGKTLLSQILLERIDPARCRAILVLATPGMGKTALLREMLRESGSECGSSRSGDLLDALHRSALDLFREGKRLAVIVDEAHFLGAPALHMLRTISNLEAPGGKLVTCLLFAEEGLARRLAHPGYRSLVTRMYHRVSLAPMTPEESAQYLRFRLLAAGGREDIFEEDACRAVAERSGGICREVSRLGYLALVEGASRGIPRVTRALVEEV